MHERVEVLKLMSFTPLSLVLLKLLIHLGPHLIHLLLVDLGKNLLKLPLLSGFSCPLKLKGFLDGFCNILLLIT